MFFGSIPALVTPFSGGRVAADTFCEFVEWQISEGSDALVLCGTTGEGATLSSDEHREVIAAAVRVAKGRVPVIAGCGTYSTAASIERARAAADLGADAALIVVPYYNKPSQAGLAAHFSAIADASPLPIVVYNVPSRTVADISVETLAEIAKHPKIVAVKDATILLDARLGGMPVNVMGVHEFVFDLQTDSHGDFFFTKGAPLLGRDEDLEPFTEHTHSIHIWMRSTGRSLRCSARTRGARSRASGCASR